MNDQLECFSFVLLDCIMYVLQVNLTTYKVLDWFENSICYGAEEMIELFLVDTQSDHCFNHEIGDFFVLVIRDVGCSMLYHMSTDH